MWTGKQRRRRSIKVAVTIDGWTVSVVSNMIRMWYRSRKSTLTMVIVTKGRQCSERMVYDLNLRIFVFFFILFYVFCAMFYSLKTIASKSWEMCIPTFSKFILILILMIFMNFAFFFWINFSNNCTLFFHSTIKISQSKPYISFGFASF